MHFLTRIRFDAGMMAHLRIRDAYTWHQRAWECFPGRDGQARHFLTRLEEHADHLRLLLLSESPPTRPDWCPAVAWEGPKSISERFRAHRRYRFALCANPTKKVKAFTPDGTERPNGRRVPLCTPQERAEWLQRKGQSGGFSVDTGSLNILTRPVEPFKRQNQTGLHGAVEFEGVLVVTDAATFWEHTFAKGIGSAKAFGFGMLALVPVRNGEL